MNFDLSPKASAVLQRVRTFIADRIAPVEEEVLRDLTHISQAAVETGADAEEEEQAYAEIVEYVRAGVQLIHDELLEARTGVAGAADPSRLN